MMRDTSHNYEKEEDSENSPDFEKDTEYIEQTSEMNGGKHTSIRKKHTLKRKGTSKKNIHLTKRKKQLNKRGKYKTKKNYRL
jgi:hypothetical protein